MLHIEWRWNVEFIEAYAYTSRHLPYYQLASATGNTPAKTKNIYRWTSLQWIESRIISPDLCIHSWILGLSLENPFVHNVLSQKCGLWETIANSRSSDYVDQ